MYLDPPAATAIPFFWDCFRFQRQSSVESIRDLGRRNKSRADLDRLQSERPPEAGSFAAPPSCNSGLPQMGG